MIIHIINGIQSLDSELKHDEEMGDNETHRDT